jgi:hypothetical protein
MRALLLAVMAVAAMALAGCDRGAAASGGGDQLGSLEASVDAISRQVDSDAAG